MPRSRSHTRRAPRSNPQGVLEVHRGGYGFVRTSEGEFFVSASKMGGAFDGDVVELAPLPRDRSRNTGIAGGVARQNAAMQQRPAARVVRVVDRSCETLVGRYEIAEPFGVVVPVDTRIPYDIFTLRSDRPDIEDGALVRVRIETYPSRHTAATGVVEEVFGQADDASAGVDAIVARHELETEFSAAALHEAREAVLDEGGALVSGYRDLRDRFVFTVDPAGARDFDDALSLEAVVRCDDVWVECSTLGVYPGADEEVFSSSLDFHEEGRACERARFSRRAWRLGVHIADVSHYVPWGCALDVDARRRSTSVYLVDRVIPLLPHELSSGLCSLKPGEVRRVVTIDLYLDDKGNLLDFDAYPSLIRSNARLTYDEVQDVLSAAAKEGGSVPARFEDLAPRLTEISRLAKERASRRAAQGGLDFDTVEAKVRLDGEGHPVAVDVRRKTDATELVEESMILANETVACYLLEQGVPSLYRVHEQPDAGSMAACVELLRDFPWFEKVDASRFAVGDALAVQQVLKESAGRSEEALVSQLLLRSMKRAVYKACNEGHYGLASEVYTHFTSPIRRYPDLVVHRMLKAKLRNRLRDCRQWSADLPAIAKHASRQERVADDAARESQELKVVEYLQQDIGCAFSAVVVGVTTSGLRVRLDNTAEGFVSVRSLGNECFSFDPVHQRLSGQDTNAVYRLGQRVPVVLLAADPRTRTLEFGLASSR